MSGGSTGILTRLCTLVGILFISVCTVLGGIEVVNKVRLAESIRSTWSTIIPVQYRSVTDDVESHDIVYR